MSAHAHIDPIAVVEACYRFSEDTDGWLRGVVRASRPLFESNGGLGTLGFLIDAERTTPCRPYLLAFSAEGVPEKAFAGFTTIASLGVQAEVVAGIRAAGSVSTLSAGLGARFSQAGGFEQCLQSYAVGDSAYVLAADPLGVCCVLASPHRTRSRMPEQLRTIWQLVAAHIGAAFRLRQGSTGRQDPTQDADAVFDVNGKLRHAAGAARSAENRQRLQQAALRTFAARGTLRSEDPLAALALWKALVSGRWSLVDWFDSDGQRLLIARRNVPGCRAHAALSPREAQVASLGALGHPNKIIAYELGLSLSSVSTLLRRALQKLGFCGRHELVALFERTLP